MNNTVFARLKEFICPTKINAWGFQATISLICGTCFIYVQLVVISCLEFNSGAAISDFGIMEQTKPEMGLIPMAGVSPWGVFLIYVFVSCLIVLDLIMGYRGLIQLKLYGEKMLKDLRDENIPDV